MQNHFRSLWTWFPPLAALLLMGVIHFCGSNQSLFLGLNRAGHVFGNDWWSLLTILGDGAIALALLLPGIRRYPQRFWAALVAAVIVITWVHACKNAMPLPRPLAVLPNQEFFQIGPRLRAGSFPSGHSAAIFALVGIWTIGISGRFLLRSVLLLAGVLVAGSRIMVGVHWPLDVLSGMLIGWLSAYAALLICHRWRWKTSGAGGLIAGSVLLIIAVGLMFSRHTGFEAAIGLQCLLGFVCVILGAREMYLLFPFLHRWSDVAGKYAGK